MKQAIISNFTKRRIIFGLAYCLILNSCLDRTKPKVNFSKESFDFKKMDTISADNSLEPQKQKNNSLAYEDINFGDRILLGSISKGTITKEQIQSVINVGFNIEKYGSLGYLSYEKCDAWELGQDYKYHFDDNGRPMYLVTYNGMDTIKYSYDKEMKLITCGIWTVKYYPNGFKKSAENSFEIEKYEYDIYGNICHINFDIKPGILACGNRTNEWFGEYDKNHRLVRDLKIGFPSSQIEIYKYSDVGDIIQSVRFDDFGKDTLIDSTFPFIDSLLEKYGEFFPVAAAITKDGKIASVATYDGNERPSSDDVIKSLKKVLRDGSLKGDYVAAVIFYDIRVISPFNEGKTDAVAVHYECIDDPIAKKFFYPYKLTKKKELSFTEGWNNIIDKEIFIR